MTHHTGAEEKLEQCYRELRAPILRRLYRLVGDAETAEDLYQTTFLKALRHKEDLVALESPTAWLTRIATNSALDYLRIKRRTRLVSLDTVDNAGSGPQHQHAPEAVRPANQPGSEELDAALDIRAALEQLPNAKRMTLLLYYGEGYSIADIALLTATRSGTLRSRLSRARQQLRRLYTL